VDPAPQQTFTASFFFLSHRMFKKKKERKKNDKELAVCLWFIGFPRIYCNARN